MSRVSVRICSAILFLSLAMSAFSDDKPDDVVALKGVTTGKVVWDINVSSPAKLVLYLDVIKETYDDLVRQGISPEMVFAFRGESLRIVSTEHDPVTLDSMPEIQEAARKIHMMMHRAGVRMEACSIAARVFDVNLDHVPHGIRPVGNTFISLIGYQAKGYAIIPIY